MVEISVNPGMASAAQLLALIAGMSEGEEVRITKMQGLYAVSKTSLILGILASHLEQFKGAGTQAYNLPNPDRPCPNCHAAALGQFQREGVILVGCQSCGMTWEPEAGKVKDESGRTEG